MMSSAATNCKIIGYLNCRAGVREVSNPTESDTPVFILISSNPAKHCLLSLSSLQNINPQDAHNAIQQSMEASNRIQSSTVCSLGTNIRP